MKYRPMGSLGWEVSALGFGCMRLPRSGLVVKTVDSKEAITTIRRGIDRGVNYVDTAWMYHLGKSEEIVGEALRDGYRERVKLVTKLPVSMCRKPEDFDSYLDRQLKKLQTDHLDVYLLHGLGKATWKKAQRLGYVEQLDRAREAGKIRHVGFSFHDTAAVFREIVDHREWDVVMVQHNYMDTGLQATSDGVEYAHSKGIAVVAMEPLKGGTLANPTEESMAIMGRSPVPRSPVDWALQYLWNKPEIACVLSGMSAREQVEQNCDSAERSGVGSLTDEELEIIDELAEVFRRNIVVPCTACGYCMPCKDGVDIPDCFAILNNVAVASGGPFLGRAGAYMLKRRYRKKPRTKKQLEKAPDTGSAALCTQCGACVPKCPQAIDVPTELAKAHAVLAGGGDLQKLIIESS